MADSDDTVLTAVTMSYLTRVASAHRRFHHTMTTLRLLQCAHV